jgi:hypothetical protein
VARLVKAELAPDVPLDRAKAEQLAVWMLRLAHPKVPSLPEDARPFPSRAFVRFVASASFHRARSFVASPRCLR